MPISTRMANVMKIAYKTKNTPPIDFLSLNLPMNRVSQSKEVATKREPTTKSMPTELIFTAVSEPSTNNIKVLISQGRPKANNIAKELAPNAFDTPIPPSPVTEESDFRTFTAYSAPFCFEKSRAGFVYQAPFVFDGIQRRILFTRAEKIKRFSYIIISLIIFNAIVSQ